MQQMRSLEERKVQWHESMGFSLNVLCDVKPTGVISKDLRNERALRKAQELYEGKGKASGMASANGTPSSAAVPIGAVFFKPEQPDCEHEPKR